MPITALIPIDMQRGFDMGDNRLPRWNNRADTNGMALLDRWRRKGWPILHVRHDSIEPTSILRPGQPGNDFRDGFEPLANEPVISKSVNSAFIGTDLDLRLKRLGVTEVVCFGITTDQCVSTTIRTGSNMGWQCVLVEDACDCLELPGRDGKPIAAQDIHRAHVATLGYEFCTVRSTSELLSVPAYS